VKSFVNLISLGLLSVISSKADLSPPPLPFAGALPPLALGSSAAA
jgi:hypothetical protein